MSATFPLKKQEFNFLRAFNDIKNELICFLRRHVGILYPYKDAFRFRIYLLFGCVTQSFALRGCYIVNVIAAA